MPPAHPLVCKIFNIYHRKKNENYVEFYFSMGTVLVIFFFFSMDNDLVCAPPPLSGMSSFRHHNYAHTFAYSLDFRETLGNCYKQSQGMAA